MFRKSNFPAWGGIILLSGMFLMGQTTWGPQYKTVFVTDGVYEGSLDGLDGADAICQAEADAAGLAGIYKAWLSDSTESPDTRFVKSSVPYSLVDGTQIAENWQDLTDGELDHAISLTALGVEPVSIFAWSNTEAQGYGANPDMEACCMDWRDNDFYGHVGENYVMHEAWSESGVMEFCMELNTLYCFEQ